MEPVTGRPSMPGYGVLPGNEGSGLLDWQWAADRLRESHDYWLATVRPDGRPHVAPVWGVYLEERLWFSTGPLSRKAENLRSNPAVVVTTDAAFSPVIVEGDAAWVTEPERIGRFAEAMDAKYGTDYGVDFYVSNATFAIRPGRAIGIDGNDFVGSPTRWTFHESPPDPGTEQRR